MPSLSLPVSFHLSLSLSCTLPLFFSLSHPHPSDIHWLYSCGSEPVPGVAPLHARTGALVHGPPAGRAAATRVCRGRQLLLQHAPQPQGPVLCHKVSLQPAFTSNVYSFLLKRQSSSKAEIENFRLKKLVVVLPHPMHLN